MITIDGLTKRQCLLLDIMWAIDSYDDYTKWKSGLSESDYRTVDILESMVMLAENDDIEDVTEANAVLSKIFSVIK
jgi:hypothetical protein